MILLIYTSASAISTADVIYLYAIRKFIIGLMFGSSIRNWMIFEQPNILGKKLKDFS